MSSSDSIQVAIRVRPLSEQEQNSGYQNIVKKTANEPQISVGSSRNGACLFTFNHVFGETDSQERVYTDSVQHMIKKLFEGYNVTILAYGQTGSGKTHTMDTNYNGIPTESMGIIPRAVLEIFENIGKMKKDHDVVVKCCFVELYNEQLFDLLSNAPNRDNCIVDIREDVTKGIIIPGVTEIEVNSIEEIIRCLVKGSSGRAVGATAMNATSSRSHAIFTVTIQVEKIDNPNLKTCSRFHLVDLAGSERSKKTKATGNRLKEGIKINQGLFALGKCITALGGSNSASFIPYRESKLTRLLQDSLGGNSVTLLIACVSPADSNMDETLNTLNYANRAKNIKNKPIVNHDPDAVELENWEKKAQMLRLDILNLENISCLPIDDDGNMSIVERESVTLLKNDLKQVQNQNQDLQVQFRNAMTSLLGVEMKDDLIEKAYKELNEIVNKVNDIIYRLLEDPKISHHHLFHYKNIQTIVDEMKSLLVSIDASVQVIIKNEDIREYNGNTNSNDGDPVIMNANDVSESHDEDEDMDVDKFHKKQLGFTNEIQQITKQIAIKEELQKQILGNLPSFLDDNTKLHEKITELENTIKTLEAERIDLQSQILMVEKMDTATNKVADERQTKIIVLEKKMETLTKQYKQQQKLLELREADAERIKQLQNEIKELKATRVRITREMKKCHVQFKKWTFNKNVEINKIRGLERKKQSEMTRLSLSNKQKQSVLRRRMMEALTGIKNLELKIEKKRTVQLSRRRVVINKTIFIKNIIEAILTIIETETSLEHLKRNKEHLITLIETLKQENPLRQDVISDTESELKKLVKQIGLYHQQIISSKKEEKIKLLIDETSSIEEQREVVKCLFGDIIYLNKEISEKNIGYHRIVKSKDALQNKCRLLEAKNENINQKFISDLNFIERRNEEKIGQLLRDMQCVGQQNDITSTSNRDKLTEEACKKKLEFMKILNDLRQENVELQNDLAQLHEQVAKGAQISIYDEDDVGDFEVDMFDDIVDDHIHDPDWIMDNEKIIITRNRSQNTNNSSANTNSSDTSKKRKVSAELIKCGCTKSCSSKMCKCRKNDLKCNDKCKCNASCPNASGSDEHNFNDDTGENNKNSINISNEKIGNHTITFGDESTPKKQKLTINELDVTTPCYPYAKKERKPFYIAE